MLEFLENALITITQYGILLLEFAGVGIILGTAIRCMICGIKHNGIVPLMLDAHIDRFIAKIEAGYRKGGTAT